MSEHAEGGERFGCMIDAIYGAATDRNGKMGERRQTDLVLRVMSDRAAIMASQTVR